MNDVDPSTIQTEVFRLPTVCFAEEDGSIANSVVGCNGIIKLLNHHMKLNQM